MRGTDEIVCRTYTPPQVAKMWGMGIHKVWALIHSGELRAMNTVLPGKTKGRYMVTVEAIREFEQARQVVPTPPKRKRRAAAGKVESRY